MPTNKKTKGINYRGIAEWQKDWPKDKLTIARYSLRCQKCKKQFPLDFKWKKEYFDKVKEIATEETFEFEIPTKQFRKRVNVIEGCQFAFPRHIIGMIIKQWKANNKSVVRRLYAIMNGREKEPIMCDDCYKIKKLIE